MTREFGAAPQQAVLRILPQGKILKMCKCMYTYPACRLAEKPEMLINNSVKI